MCSRDRLIAQGMAAKERLNEAKFTLGYLAVQAAKLPKPHKMNVRRFAKEIGVEATKLRDYRTVAAYYGESDAVKEAREWANLTWSHWREAMRSRSRALTHAENVQASLNVLADASDGNWSVSYLGEVITARRDGEPEPVTAICFDSTEDEITDTTQLVNQVRVVLRGIETRQTTPIVRIYERSIKESEYTKKTTVTPRGAVESIEMWYTESKD